MKIFINAIIVVVTLSLTTVTADDCYMNNDYFGQFSICIDSASRLWYCPNHCGEYTPIANVAKGSIDCASECNPDLTFSSYTQGWCVDDEGGTNYPHCQNAFANEWSDPNSSPNCVVGTTCTMGLRYKCTGHEITVVQNLPIGMNTTYDIGSTPLQFGITFAQTDPSITIDPTCTLNPTMVNCKVYERLDANFGMRTGLSQEITDPAILTLTTTSTGWVMTLPLATETCMQEPLAVICGSNYGSYAHWRSQSNEFSFEVKGTGSNNPYIYNASATSFDKITGAAQVVWTTSEVARLFTVKPNDCTAAGTGNRYSLWSDSAATVPYSAGKVFFDTSATLSERAYPLMAVSSSFGPTTFYIKMEHVTFANIISPMITVNFNCGPTSLTKLLGSDPPYCVKYDGTLTVTAATIASTWFTIGAGCPFTAVIYDTVGVKIPVAESWAPFDYTGNEAGGDSSVLHDIAFRAMESPNTTQSYVMKVDFGGGTTAEQTFMVERSGSVQVSQPNQSFVYNKQEGARVITASNITSWIAPTSVCAIQGAELCTDNSCSSSFTSSHIIFNSSSTLVQNVQDILVNSFYGEGLYSFYIRATNVGGSYGYISMEIEVCGTETIVPLQTELVFEIIPANAILVTSENDLKALFNVSSSNCSIEEFGVDTPSGLAVITSGNILEINDSYTGVLSTYILGAITKGQVIATIPLQINFCGIRVSETSFDFVFMQNSFLGLTSIELAPFYSTVENSGCYFQNFAIQTYNSTLDSYSDVSFSNNIAINFTATAPAARRLAPTRGRLLAAVVYRKLDISTTSPLSNFTSPYVLYAKMEDRFGNIGRKEFSILICGGEQVIPVNENFDFNYTHGTVDDENIAQQAILDFKSYMTSNIAECPITLWQLNSTETLSLYTGTDIKLDETLNQINVSTSANIHKEIILWSSTNASVGNYKTFTVNICGGEEITLNDAEPVSFGLNLTLGETLSLSTLSEIGNFSEWFNKNDDLCPWGEFSLKKLNNDTLLLEDFTNEMITLDGEKLDISVKTDTFMSETFYLTIAAPGGPVQAKKISIFICGQERVSTKGGANKIETSWDEDTVFDISAETVKASFKSSDEERCPVVSYHLTYDLAEVEPKISLSGSQISLTSYEEPSVSFMFSQMYAKFEKLTTFYIVGCTFAKKCSEITVDLKKTSCDDSILTADTAPILKSVSAESSESVGKSEYENSYTSSNPKCPVEKFGLLESRGEGDLESSIYGGLVLMSSSGEVTFDGEAMLAGTEAQYTFVIVGTTEANKRAFKDATVDVAIPEPVEEEVEEEVVEEEVVDEPVEEEPAVEEEVKEEVEEVEEEEEPPSNPKKTVPGVFAFSPDWAPKKKKKRPPQQFSPDGTVVEYVPPVPPSVRVITISSKGEVSIKFSDDVEMPSSWSEKLTYDKARKLHGIEGARHLSKGSFLTIRQEGATNGQKDTLNNDNIMLESLSSKEVNFKIRFDNPALVSMGDQSINDRLLIAFSAPLYGKNGELLDTSKLPANEDGLPEPKFDIQPMVDEESEEQKSLDNAAGGVFNVGLILMIVQFVVTLIASTSLSFFFELINSQVNYCYLPLMTVNPPGQVSFYLDILIFIVTFDPVPMDIVYEFIPIFDFNYVNEANDVPVFSRIGMEDRNMLAVLGSVFLFMFLFFVIQVLYFVLVPFKQTSNRVRNLLKIICIDSAYRTMFIIFFTETYMDLLLGGLLNTENFYLMYDRKNWGSSATAMTFADQFCISIGTIIYAVCMLFPFVVVILLNQGYKLRYQSAHKRHHFNMLYDFLYTGLKTNTQGITQYFSVYLIRKFLYALLVYYYRDMQYTLMQVMANTFLSFAFLMYLAAYRPFIDNQTFRINLFNELFMYMVSLLYITFTDFNPDAYAKVMMGWLVIFLVISNLIFPNGYIMVQGLWPDVKVACCGKKETQRLNLLRKNKRRFRLKSEFEETEEFDFDQPVVKCNQITPSEFFKKLGSGNADLFGEDRAGKRQTKKTLKKLSQRIVAKVYNKDPSLSVLEEEDEDLEFEDSVLSQMRLYVINCRATTK